jgi:predicted membrane-bound spermidine synthase
MASPNQGTNASIVFLTVVFLLSFCVLTIEISLTRVFSATIWYHYAFMAVSIALFGLGAGGVILHILKPKLSPKMLPALPVISVLLFVVSIPFFLYFIKNYPADPSSLNYYYATSIVPFFLAGVSISFIFDTFVHIAPKLYFADLIGASLGCLLAEPLLGIFGGESTILMSAVLSSIALVFLSLKLNRKTLSLALIVSISISGTLFFNTQTGFLNLNNAPTKGMYRILQENPDLKIADTKWNSFSRIDVIEKPNDPLVLAEIFIDGDASTPICRFDGNLSSMIWLKQWMPYLPYAVTSQSSRTLIIGPGGGVDIIAALVGGSKEVDAVELNPLIVETVKSYGEEAGNIYTYDGVNAFVDEGRSFISRSNEKYDVIVANLIDSGAAVASGGYALAENYLYTEEAFEQYLNHLTDKGILMFARWGDEIPRLLTTTIEAFQSINDTMSISEIGTHISAVSQISGFNLSIYMVKKTPFDMSQSEQILTFSEELNLKPVLVPNVVTEAPYKELFQGNISIEYFYTLFPFRVQPVTDDNPYYFSWAPTMQIPSSLRDIIVMTSVLVVGFSFVPFLFSFFFSKRIDFRPRSKKAILFIGYFSALGLGFMMLEVVLLQRFVLFLGSPTLSLSVTLFSLLLSSGIGSFVSGRVNEGRLRKLLLMVFPLICLLTFCYLLFLPSLLMSFLSSFIALRIILAVVLLFPLGLLMGMPFPTGLRILSQGLGENVKWMWGVNGMMSVLGSVLVPAIGILSSLSNAMILGGSLYFVAFIVVLALRTELEFR